MRATVVLIPLLLASTAMSQQPTPVMEYASVLTGLRVRHQTGVIEFEEPNHALACVFLPAETPVLAVITEKGSKTPLAQQTFGIAQANGVFNRISSRGAITQYAVKAPGDYTVHYLAGRQLMSSVDFSVEVEKNDDQFLPKAHYYAKGPWDRWAYLYAPLPDSGNTQPEFRMWVHKRSFADAPPADEYDLELMREGDVIGTASTGFNSTKEVQQLRFKWRHPESRGGGAMTVEDLTDADGAYFVVAKKNGKPHGVWTFTIKEGRPQLHARQANDFRPRAKYIVPRVSGITDTAPGMVVFMERLSDVEAEAALAMRASSSGSMADIDPSRWVWTPRSIDPNRGFELNVTGIETRTDTGLAVGEDMVVFGTGFPNGVKYMLAGDQQPRHIPAGETFSSKVFCVCGRKIVLTKRNRVYVFDTENGKMIEIPETDVSLYNPSASQVNSHGYLVATVNRALSVNDRTIIKVIDVSGDEAVIIPIKNANYTDADVTSVGVDSKNGGVVISSARKKLICAAKIAPRANQFVYDVSEYRGVAPFPLVIEGEDITYVDEDWNLRRLDLSDKSPKAVTQEKIARSGNGFWVRKGRVVTFTREGGVGSRLPAMISDSADAPRAAPGTGSDIAGTSAKLGFGGSAAIAIDKSVFLAGTAGDSIGTGERLQVLGDDGWRPILGVDGKPVWGSEVVTSMGFMAVKVRDDAGKTVVGYATYGQRIDVTAVNKSAVVAGGVEPKMSGPKSSVPSAKSADGKPPLSEVDVAFIEAMLESETEIITAYKAAFGIEGAKEKLLEGWKKTLESSDRMHLLDELKRRSQSFKP
ncbi:MAG: hypothetical protein AAFU85_07405 [Planctomycetota bacterium]